MTQYIIILLDDTSVSFCHYGNGKKERNLMSLETLKAAIIYAMKENLNPTCSLYAYNSLILKCRFF